MTKPSRRKDVAKALAILLMIIFICSCTKSQRTRWLGSSMEIVLPAGEKLINVSWKDEDLWYLTRPMRDDEVAEVYQYKEKSAFGMFQGTITIREVRAKEDKP